MKENSIEEDMKILEKNVESVKENSDMAFFETDEDYYFFKAVEHILSDYKRVLKENEEWQKAYQEEKDKQFELIQNTNNTIKTAVIAIEDLQGKLKEVIPVQKVKEKIKELENEYEYLAKENQRVNKLEIQLLQGLLESED